MIKNYNHKVNKVQKKEKTNLIPCILLGLVVGAINGLLGGGGGMIVVPLLTFLMHSEDKKAHATAILIILPLCTVSSIIYATSGVWDWQQTLWCGVGAIAGGIGGALFLKKLSNKVIRIIFSALMIVAGIKMIL